MRKEKRNFGCLLDEDLLKEMKVEANDLGYSLSEYVRLIFRRRHFDDWIDRPDIAPDLNVSLRTTKGSELPVWMLDNDPEQK